MNKNELMKEKNPENSLKNPNTRLQDGSNQRIEPFNGINIAYIGFYIGFYDNQNSTYMQNLMSCRVDVTKSHLT